MIHVVLLFGLGTAGWLAVVNVIMQSLMSRTRAFLRVLIAEALKSNQLVEVMPSGQRGRYDRRSLKS